MVYVLIHLHKSELGNKF